MNPITRRRFLSQGAIAFSATMLSPTLFGLLKSGEAAADEPIPPLPFLIFDCAGGAAFPGNFLVGREEDPKKLLKSYSTLGWNPQTAGFDESLGLPMANVGQFRTGINQTASAEARKNLRLGSFCHFAQDDNPGNPLSPYFLLASWGYKGTTLQRGMGSTNSNSGGFSEGVLPDISKKPIFVGSLDDIAANLKPPGPLANFPGPKLASLTNQLSKLSYEQIKKFEGSEEGGTLAQRIRDALGQNQHLVENPYSYDPRLDKDFAAVYQLNAGSAVNSQNVIFSGIVKGVLSKNSGAGALTIGGCDYHNGSNVTGDQKDLEIGQNVGRAVEMAHRSKTPLFFCLITDGSMYADASTRNWRSDAGDKCMSVIGYYDPTGPKTMRKIQVGSYTEGQSADFTTLIGKRPDRVACAIFGNYLSLQNRMDDFEKVVPRGLLTRQEMEQLLIFG